MEVKSAYTQSEVGLIPEDWIVKQLAQCAQVRSGVAKNANVKLSDPKRVHYLRVANVQDGFLDLTEMSEIEIERTHLSRYLVLPGDVLMNEGGDRDKLGRGCIWSGEFTPCVHQNHVFVVRCRPPLSPRYLTAWTGSAPAKHFFANAGSQTTNLASINKTSIGHLPIPLPPTRTEQEAIAEALSDADALIESLEQLVAKKRQIKYGAMQELLTGKRRQPGFDGGWSIKRLGQIGATYGGLSGKTKADFGNGEARYITFLGVMNNVIINVGQVEPVNVRPGEHQNATRRGDLFFNGSSETPEEVGMCALLNDDVSGLYLNSFCFGFRLFQDDLVDRLYLTYFLRSGEGRKLLYSLAQGATRHNLSKAALMAIQVKLPTFKEQSAIAAVLADMDAEITAVEAKLAKARQVKQGMMQELLTGRIRLI